MKMILKSFFVANSRLSVLQVRHSNETLVTNIRRTTWHVFQRCFMLNWLIDIDVFFTSHGLNGMSRKVIARLLADLNVFYMVLRAPAAAAGCCVALKGTQWCDFKSSGWGRENWTSKAAHARKSFIQLVWGKIPEVWKLEHCVLQGWRQVEPLVFHLFRQVHESHEMPKHSILELFPQSNSC